MTEQRNTYKGAPPRPWMRVVLLALDGTIQELEFLADTGSPFALVIGKALMQQFQMIGVSSVSSNFGQLEGGWLRFQIPETSFDEDILGYGSDNVAQAVQASHPDFQGLAGLPLLRMMEFGGNRDEFWIQNHP